MITDYYKDTRRLLEKYYHFPDLVCEHAQNMLQKNSVAISQVCNCSCLYMANLVVHIQCSSDGGQWALLGCLSLDPRLYSNDSLEELIGSLRLTSDFFIIIYLLRMHPYSRHGDSLTNGI